MQEVPRACWTENHAELPLNGFPTSAAVLRCRDNIKRETLGVLFCRFRPSTALPKVKTPYNIGICKRQEIADPSRPRTRAISGFWSDAPPKDGRASAIWSLPMASPTIQMRCAVTGAQSLRNEHTVRARVPPPSAAPPNAAGTSPLVTKKTAISFCNDSTGVPRPYGKGLAGAPMVADVLGSRSRYAPFFLPINDSRNWRNNGRRNHPARPKQGGRWPVGEHDTIR